MDQFLTPHCIEFGLENLLVDGEFPSYPRSLVWLPCSADRLLVVLQVLSVAPAWGKAPISYGYRIIAMN